MVARRAAFASLTLVAAGAAACTSIIGIDDRTLIAGDASAEAGPTAIAEAGADVHVSGDGAPLGDSANGPRPDAGVDGVAPDVATATDSATGPDTAIAPDSATSADGAADAPITSSCPDPCELASGLNQPFLMTGDATHVYWTEYGDGDGSGNGSVKSCAATGCGAGPTVLAQGLTNPRGIAVDATNVYFATASYGGVDGAIWKCALPSCTGGAVRLAAAGIPWGVAVDTSYVYWADWDDGTVHRVAKTSAFDPNGGQLLYDGGDYDDAGHSIDEPGQIATDGTNVYVVDYVEDVLRIAVGGGTPAFVASGYNNGRFGSQYGVTTDSQSVYFGGMGSVLRSTKAAPGAVTTVGVGVPNPLGIAIDTSTSTVYWADFGSGNGTGSDGTIGKGSIGGTGQTVLQASVVTPRSVAVVGGSVFWIGDGPLDSNGDPSPNAGTLWRTTK